MNSLCDLCYYRMLNDKSIYSCHCQDVPYKPLHRSLSGLRVRRCYWFLQDAVVRNTPTDIRVDVPYDGTSIGIDFVRRNGSVLSRVPVNKKLVIIHKNN